MKTMLIAILAVAGLVATNGAVAQTGGSVPTDEQQLIQKVQSDKRSVVLSAMNLTAPEMSVFVPIYDQYQADMKEQMTRGGELLNKYASNYDSMTDDAAKQLLKEFFKYREERAEVLQKYAKRMAGKLPPTKVLRWVQIENKLTTLLDWQAAQVIPLAR